MGRNTIIEAHGEFPVDRFNTNAKIVDDLWNEIAELADFDKNGEVDVDEFKQAVMKHCVGKSYAQFPKAFKAFIENQFKAVDVDGDGHVGLPEYRADAITRSAFTDIAEIDEAYSKLVNDATKLQEESLCHDMRSSMLILLVVKMSVLPCTCSDHLRNCKCTICASTGGHPVQNVG